MNFNELNSHTRDHNVDFNQEAHIYTIFGQEYLSVTSLINQFFPQFNTQYWAEKKAQRLGVSPETLLEEWRQKGEAASIQGTLLHSNIEKYLLGEVHGEEGAFPLFLKFRKDHPTLLPYRTEWAIYDEEYEIAGTIDFLESHGGKYDMYDWKCSTKLLSDNGTIIKEHHFHETGLQPITHLDNTPYHHYALQQSMYRYILEKNYNIPLRSCSLVVLHPNYKNYHIIKLPYLYKEVKAMLDKYKKKKRIFPVP